MTESEWLSCRDSRSMVRYLSYEMHKCSDAIGDSPRNTPLVSGRKLRLFACACWRLLGYDHKVAASVAVVENHIEANLPPPDSIYWINRASPRDSAEQAAWAMSNVGKQVIGAKALSDIIGNPFRPAPTLHYSTGLHDHVWDIASVAYDETRPDGTIDPFHLGVLADALEEAGCPTGVECLCENAVALDPRGPGGQMIAHWCRDCQNTGIKTHPVIENLRSPGSHYRGMWSLDIVLGKS